MIIGYLPTLQPMLLRSILIRGMSTKVAVILSGCGVYDGTEVHESCAVLTHLSRHGAEVSIFAPDKVFVRYLMVFGLNA